MPHEPFEISAVDATQRTKFKNTFFAVRHRCDGLHIASACGMFHPTTQ
jgi:hypothetical protein